jgi:hypothetical protein
MSAKARFSSVLVLALFTGYTAQGQSPAAPPAETQPAVLPAPTAAPLPPAIVPGPVDHAGPSCNGPDCHGPVGADGFIIYEAYVRNGLSIPFGGGVLARSLDVGWDVQGGVRSLFFNQGMDAAWTVDASISNIVQHASMNPIILDVAGGFFLPASANELNRTYANLALGGEWYLAGSANGTHRTWRAGFDVGGRWGTAKVELHDAQHRTGVLTGVFAAVHSDYEIPCGCYLFVAGVRAEWGYTFSDILQSQNDSDVMDINLMLTAGVRF